MKHEILHLKDYFPFLGENGCDPTLEFYFPYNSKEMKHENIKRPCLIICPGGAYGACSDREAEPIALHFPPEGFNVFILRYSVSPHRFPTQLIEIAALMELIYKNAEKWNCNTEKIAIMGFSAGGHLAAHYSTMFDCKEVRNVFPESKSVNASVLCYPVITSDPEYSHKESFINLLGVYPDEDKRDYFSCEKCIKETTPPAFLWHMSGDTDVTFMNSLLYAEALAKYKIPTELHIYPFGWHGTSTCDIHTNNKFGEDVVHAAAWLDSLKEWFKLIGFNIERQ